jgi:serine phosphatase RsbU (regulator of sigma subunit)/anti-sigma regulatory factor (Ser/Thr protein kinase)
VVGRGDLIGLPTRELLAALDAAEEGLLLYAAIRDGERIVDFRLVHINSAGARVAGRPPAELIDQRMSVLFPATATTGLIGECATVVEGGGALSRTVPYDDGRLNGYFDVHGRRVGDGLLLCVSNLSLATVTHPRSHAEVLLRSALDAAFDGFTLLTAVRDDAGDIVDFDISYVNEIGARLAGQRPSQMVGRRISVASPGAVRHGLFTQYARVADTGDTFQEELGDLPGGSVWEFKATRVVGDVVAVSYREVTHRVRQQRLVEASEARARLAAGRIAVLQAVTAALARANTVADVLAVMTRQHADWAGGEGLLVFLREGDRLVLRHHSGYPPQCLERASELPLDGDSSLAVAARLGTALFHRSPEAPLRADPGPVGSGPVANLHAWAVAPLVSAGAAVGGLVIGYRQEHDFDDGERELIVALAEVYAQALERTRLFEAQRSIAADLQRALLPAALPRVDGARYAARYLPWTEAADVGGDWYDVIRLDADTVAVTIGDVAGHSVQAAATMGLIRNAVRAYALERHSATSVVERTNRMLVLTEPDAVATCCYIELHLSEGTATAVIAGHLPPVQLRDGEATVMALRTGPPLGVVANATYTDTTVLLPAGASLLLYTDGLVEDRRYDIERGLRDLCKAIAQTVGDDPRALVDRVLAAEVGPHPRSDDAALLALTVDAVPVDGAPPTATRRFTSDARSVSSARRFAADVLTAWGLGRMVDVTRLLLGEVATNAVQHTVGDVRVRLTRLPAALRVQVYDSSDRRPDVRTADADSESGRGLVIVESLADAWGFESVDATSKVVWFELALRS